MNVKCTVVFSLYLNTCLTRIKDLPDMHHPVFGLVQLLLKKIGYMLGVLNDTEIEEVLKNQIIGRIGCHADDTTYVVPTSYAYDGEKIYCHSFDGMKIDLMRKNPKICFEVDILQHMALWKSVIVWGRYHEITDKEERNEALQKLLQRQLPILPSVTTHLSSSWPFPPEDLTKIKGVVYSITPEKKTGRFEDDQNSPSFAG